MVFIKTRGNSGSVAASPDLGEIDNKARPDIKAMQLPKFLIF